MEDVVGADLTLASCKNLSPVIHVLNPFVGESHCADIIAEHWRTGNFAGGLFNSSLRAKRSNPGVFWIASSPERAPSNDEASRPLAAYLIAATAQACALGRAWRRSCAPSAMNKSEAMTAIKVSKTVCKMAPNRRPIMPAIEPVTMMPRPISAVTARSTASQGITAIKKIAKMRSAQPLVSSSAAAGRAPGASTAIAGDRIDSRCWAYGAA